MGKSNCWEYFNCGQNPADETELNCSRCPVTTADSLDGINGGVRGGRACWALSQTLCDGGPQGTLIEKLPLCLECEFRKLVLREEGLRCVNTREILKRVTEWQSHPEE